MIRKILFFLCVHFAIFTSEIPNPRQMSQCKEATFFLSTPKSGTNLITSSLSAITRKPISWIYWGSGVLAPSSSFRKHPSYNRLGLPMISDFPLLYRTHYDYSKLMEAPSDKNNLIFLSRNPKELLYRKFFLAAEPSENPETPFIDDFLKTYLKSFQVYDSWNNDTKMMVFYEDFIRQGDEILLKMLHLMGEEPKFLDDYLNHKNEYLSQLLESYSRQHQHNSGGASALNEGPKAIHYSKNAPLDTLLYIDEYLMKNEPVIWEKYLKRFQVSIEP